MDAAARYRRSACAPFAALLAAQALAGCMAVPRTVEVYDAECRSTARRMVLDEVQVGSIAGCANQGCVTLIAAAGIVTAASYLVSGTIMVAGNVAYEIERRVQCRSGDEAVLVPVPVPASAVSPAFVPSASP